MQQVPTMLYPVSARFGQKVEVGKVLIINGESGEESERLPLAASSISDPGMLAILSC